MPISISPETILDGIGTLLDLGGQLYSGNTNKVSAEKTAKAYREQGDNALVVAGMNSKAYRELGDNAVIVADYNAKQFERRADQFRKTGFDIARKGVAEENDLRGEVSQLISSQKVGYAAGNVMVNRGTPAAMQISTARQGEVDALRIRDNYKSLLQANEFEAQQSLDQASLLRLEGEQSKKAAYNTASIIDTEGGFAKKAGYNLAEAAEAEGENTQLESQFNALGTVLSSPIAQKWLTDAITKVGGGSSIPGGNPPGGTTTGSKWVPTVGEFVAGVAGGVAGQKIGEMFTGNEATANWGATIGGYAGSLLGPWGAAIGAALGGFVDSAFGSSFSHNAGFLLHDVPGAPAERKFETQPFASGLKPVGFVRRSTKEEAMKVIEPFRALDKLIVDTGAEFGKKITGEHVRGTDEEGNPNVDGVFIGSASEGQDKRGKPVADHMTQFATQLLQSLEGQISAEGLAAIQGAGTVEQKIVKMREVLAQESN